MVMGSLLLISGYFLYSLLRPPVPQNFILQEELVFPKSPSLDF